MKLRKKSIESLASADREFDVLIVGSGINGAVAGAALANSGAKVALIDRGDFAGLTSSNSSNLAWGGIKYLESHEYFLVNKLCRSRNLLMKSYPSSVREIRFLTTISKGFRFPAFFVYLGTVFYWIMGRFFTQKPNYITINELARREPAISLKNAAGAFEYSDAYLFDNDSRFVFNFVRSCINSGGVVANYVESIRSKKVGKTWVTEAIDRTTGIHLAIRSKSIINACGPLVDKQNTASKQITEHRHLFSKGVHLVVNSISKQRHILTFFASDGRLFFVIPMGNKTAIGTTDTQVETPEVNVTDEDRKFILDNANSLLNLSRPLTNADIISERCGVRPLAQNGGDGVADWVKLSRKHVIETSQTPGYFSIFGGKTTDCINIGDELIALIAKMGIHLPNAGTKWYGEPDRHVQSEFLERARSINLDNYVPVGASESVSERFWRRYGIDAFSLLDKIIINDVVSDDATEYPFDGLEFMRCELEYAAEQEMVVKLEDFLRRRSMIEQTTRREALLHGDGLREICRALFADNAQAKLDEYLSTAG